jgi:hypothetical protein
VWKPTLLALALCACGGSNSPDDAAANGGNSGGAGSGAGDKDAGSAGSEAEGGAGGASAGAGGAAAAAGSGGGAAGSAGPKQSAKDLAGVFTLSLVGEREATADAEGTPARTGFIGMIYDGPRPSPNAWVEDQTAGGCTLYTPVSPLCEPSCGSEAACVMDDVCVPYTKPQSVGTISLSGLGEAAIEMSPVGPTHSYQPKAGSALPHPPCDEGDMISLSVEGGAYTGFELQTKCIAPLDFQGPVKLDKGMPLKLSWQAPTDPALARIEVNLDISHHGGTRGEVRCDVEDTGTLELPATMVDRLLELGTAGFPTIVLTRVVTGGAVGGEPENVQFIMSQYVEREILIDGLFSCSEKVPCPDGLTCQTDLSCK